ncbi:MAG TPA: bacterioferritin [Thermoguttaceae bacterium]|nr:bacterioferritin [Thermoguttaceae bacterium]
MKGNNQVIARLNDRLSEEVTAINQYFVHAQMCESWGYERLHEAVEKRALQEMKHAEKLIARILFLDGIPIVSKLNQINIGAEVAVQFDNDLAAENTAMAAYNQDIPFVGEAGDNGTRELLESILEEEEGHVDWLEAQLDQIRQMGVENYLTEQIG